MLKKRYRSEDIISKLREADILISQASTVTELTLDMFILQEAAKETTKPRSSLILN